MAFDTNDLNYPAAIDQSLNKYLTGFLNTPPDFQQTDKMFSTLMARPAFMAGPGGSFVTPGQEANAVGTANLQERGNIARQNVQDKTQAAGLLSGIGSNQASLVNSIPLLNAQNNQSGFGAFSQLFGG